MPPAALLFDFDGVLADTENVHVAAWERTFFRLGWDVPPEACARAAEEDDREILAEQFAARGIADADLEGYLRLKQSWTRSLLADVPRLYPGVPDLLRHLSGRFRLAVVTTAWRENVEITLAHAGLVSAFSLIVAKEDVSRPKPDPEPYLVALARLGLDPSETCALEDSPTGLASAIAARVPAIAVGHRHDPGAWSAAVPYLPNLRDPAALDSILES